MLMFFNTDKGEGILFLILRPISCFSSIQLAYDRKILKKVRFHLVFEIEHVTLVICLCHCGLLNLFHAAKISQMR